MSDKYWRPGQTLNLDTTEINPYKEQRYSVLDGGGYDAITRNGLISPTTARHSLKQRFPIESDYQAKLSNLPNQIQSELVNNGASSSAASVPSDTTTISREKTIVDNLIQQKTLQLRNSLSEANSFYGSDPHTKSEQEYINTFNSYLQRDLRPGETFKHWSRSYIAGYSAKLHSNAIHLLTQRSQQLNAAYSEALARQHAAQQAAAAEAARATQRRIAEQQNRQREAERAAAEKIRQEKAAAELVRQREAERAAAEEANRATAERIERERVASEFVKQREAAELAEQQSKRKIASEAANRFDTLLKHSTLGPSENAVEKLHRMKETNRKLLAAHVEASRVEREFKAFYNFQRRKKRWNLIKNLQGEIRELTRVTKATEKTESPVISGATSSVRPLIVSSEGLIEGLESPPFSLSKAVESLSNLRTALSGGPVIAFLASVFYTPTLENGELQRGRLILTIPLSQLVDKHHKKTSDGPEGLRIRAISSAQGEHSQLYLRSYDRGQPVRIRHATLVPSTNLYSFTTEGTDPITLTWTPRIPPGQGGQVSTVLPAFEAGVRIYPGARVTQVEGRTDEHPGYDFDSQDDYILEFPAESGIESVYMMATRGGPRYEPGTASGSGQEVGGNWLGSATESGGAPFPARIADQLRGQDFKNFDRFRESFWKAVAADQSLSQQFGRVDLEEMRSGAAPYTDPTDNAGGREKYEIHHKQRIADKRAVYNADNLTILTPKAHIELHRHGVQP
ncbi:S-type pyocin domain-containing protein [Pseudomonas glycinae]|uniref:S-type pyocin domain-containing protein n=1 Tax=Pseudomonas glycinae TaxID=1785145 RepID=UPI0018D893A2|nr:S-type pyocin domain-containing protein [Pseudomonas glycinae]MBH3403495.1 S-type pyocin domain-containing protein [Pseudomonas glycinae]